MATPPTEFDCEEIIKQLKKGVPVVKLEDTKNTLDTKLWSTFCDYSAAKGKYEYEEASNDAVHRTISDGIRKRSILDEEHTVMNEKIQSIQQLFNEREAKRDKEMESFFKNMEDLYTSFQKLPLEFDNETIDSQVTNDRKSLNLFEKKIANAKEEMESLKNSMRHCELVDIPHLSDITQQASCERYGDPKKLQCHLSEIRKNIELLSKRVQDIKVKYGV